LRAAAKAAQGHIVKIVQENFSEGQPPTGQDPGTPLAHPISMPGSLGRLAAPAWQLGAGTGHRLAPGGGSRHPGRFPPALVAAALDGRHPDAGVAAAAGMVESLGDDGRLLAVGPVRADIPQDQAASLLDGPVSVWVMGMAPALAAGGIRA